MKKERISHGCVRNHVMLAPRGARGGELREEITEKKPRYTNLDITGVSVVSEKGKKLRRTQV